MTSFLRPGGLRQACEMKAERPEITPLCGGTDLLVELNFDRVRPHGLLDLSGVADLADWSIEERPRDGRWLRLGAGVSYTRIIEELESVVPALAAASRTVGSRQIRNRGTVGGNLGTASPAGDALPPLAATGAEVELMSADGVRSVALDEFCTGPKRNSLRPDELIAAVRLPVDRGPQQFSKVGSRNAMVIAVGAVCVALDVGNKRVGVGTGALAPVPTRAPRAEEFASAQLDWVAGAAITSEVTREFGRLVAERIEPIDDVRASAAYRAHIAAVLAGRCLGWAWDDYRRWRECG